MRTIRTRRPALGYVLGFGLAALGGQAHAGCLSGLVGDLATPGKSAAPVPAPQSTHFTQAAYRPGDFTGPKFLQVGDRRDDDEPIVGLWQFKLNGGMDFGTQAWHADGTELMFSAGRDPATGDICQGVWRKVGPRAYTLNHIAMGYDQGFGGPLFRVHIHAIVKVDRSGRAFSGTFDAVVCTETDLTDPFQETNNCVTPPTGTISGTWVKPD